MVSPYRRFVLAARLAKSVLNALPLLLPAFVAAQERPAFVYGRLLDDATRGPIAAGSVSLVTRDGKSAGSAITDSLGHFRVAAPPGKYRLKAERIGYKTGESTEFGLSLGDVVPMDFWLSTRAVLLAPLEVRVTARQWIDRDKAASIAPFYERMKWYGKLGGVFLDREKVREWDGSSLTTMLGAAAGARSDGNGTVVLRQTCVPTIYLNGHPFRLEAGETIDRLFRPTDLEAVEVYKGAASLPGEFGGSQGTCALVLWTRRTY
jgi:hypothetical protein